MSDITGDAYTTKEDYINIKLQSMKQCLHERDETIDDLVRERDEIINDTEYRIRYRIRVELEETKKKINELERNRNKEHSDQDERIKEQDEKIDGLINERDEIADDRYKIRVELEETKKKMNILTKELKECRHDMVKDKIMIDKQANMIRCLKSEMKYVDAARDELSESLILSEEEKSYPQSKSFTEMVEEKLEILVDKKFKELVDVKEFGITAAKEERQPEEPNLITKAPGDERNKEMIKKEESDRRMSNLIIHGICEGVEKEDDKKFVKEIFTAVGVPYTAQSIKRLGIRKLGKARPIKLTMSSKKEKFDFTSKLPNLKYARDALRKISITDDHTLEERKEIGRWVKLAEERSKKENGNYVWKARGSPKQGMRLVKLHAQRA